MVLKSIPPGSTCVGIPGRVVQEERKCAIDLDHGELPDPVAEVINLLLKRQDEMEAQIKATGTHFRGNENKWIVNKKIRNGRNIL